MTVISYCFKTFCSYIYLIVDLEKKVRLDEDKLFGEADKDTGHAVKQIDELIQKVIKVDPEEDKKSDEEISKLFFVSSKCLVL